MWRAGQVSVVKWLASKLAEQQDDLCGQPWSSEATTDVFRWWRRQSGDDSEA